ncbi:DUF4625 domain-containing protein [Carboxylicivirga linearis]|uniref:DUF4625 domain-containing protein n=1 Tax=Carboxylicivirga linearis TaxID=1628157 RepID=A0ABS5JRK5_9BACT|nr:DUF4625 domain-containing protein [Carboxylicivirga linearis]MBS2097470.1 DUF4625 domain-containing protein [Carboxylicivirga linearis]
MKKLLNILTVGLLALSVTSSCKKSDDPGPDEQAPTIEFTKPSADGSTVYYRGMSMDFSATFRDDRALKQCQVNISYNSVTPSSILKGIGSPWGPAENGDSDVFLFDGEKEETISTNLFDEDIEIACLAGEYTLTFVVMDESENTFTTTVDVTIE